MEDVDSPLVNIRPVKTVLLVIVTGDRGLCGGYNNFVIKKVGSSAPSQLSWLGLSPCPVCCNLEVAERRINVHA